MIVVVFHWATFWCHSEIWELLEEVKSGGLLRGMVLV